MNSLTPPPPPSGFSGSAQGVFADAGSGSFDSWEEPRKASPLPMILGIVFLLVSLGLWWFRFELGQEWFAVLGYFLTPYAVFACLTWDVLWQRQGQKDPWFDMRPRYSTILRVVSFASLGVAVLHILEISRRVGQIAVEQGWG